MAQHIHGGLNNGVGSGDSNGGGGGGLPTYKEAVIAGATDSPSGKGYLDDGDDALVGFLEARKRRGARKKGEGEIFDAIEQQPMGDATLLQASPPGSGPTLRKSASACFDTAPSAWSGFPVYYAEPLKKQDSYPNNPGAVELGSYPARPNVPELDTHPQTPQLHPQAASLSRVSTMSDLASSLSPNFNWSFFPSAPPTPYFPPARPHSSYSNDGRQRALSTVSSVSELGAYTEHTMTPMSSSQSSLAAYPQRTRHSSMSNGRYFDPAANAPEVVSPAPPLPPKISFDTQQQPHQARMHSYDSSLPEVVPNHYADFTRHSSLPEVVHSHLSPSNSSTNVHMEQGSLHRSATQEQRERRRARLNLISEG
jgi:hypothetical protein